MMIIDKPSWIPRPIPFLKIEMKIYYFGDWINDLPLCPSGPLSAIYYLQFGPNKLWDAVLLGLTPLCGKLNFPEAYFYLTTDKTPLHWRYTVLHILLTLLQDDYSSGYVLFLKQSIIMSALQIKIFCLVSRKLSIINLLFW